MIDLRSDTFTTPTEGMRKAMYMAEVGDDVFGEDPSVNELQDYVADLLGKEAALFVPSGVMANQISIAVLTNPGEEVIVEKDSHIFYYENAAPSVISGVQLHCINSNKGIMAKKDVLDAIRPDIYYFPRTSLLCAENTHNRHGGSVIPIENIYELKKVANENDLSFHCDGARLWNACVATNLTPHQYAEPFDTISVCLSKGLGAPVGSLIVSSKSNIESARKWRKILGGGMRQAGIIASAGLYALKHHYDFLHETHESAKKFAESIAESEYIFIEPSNVETNIVIFNVIDKINVNDFAGTLKNNGILVIPVGGNSMRAVFHFQIEKKDAIIAAEIVKKTAASLFNNNN